MARGRGGDPVGRAATGDDRLGAFTVEHGLSGPLTATELEVVTWLCSRRRELGDPHARMVPLGPGRLRRYEWATLGDTLLTQLRAGHLTYLAWDDLRRPRRTTRRINKR